MRMISVLVALALAAPGVLEARCRPQASVLGDRDLVVALQQKLDESGLVKPLDTSTDPQCFALQVQVERRGEGVLLSASDPSGAAMSREASSTTIAAAVIEAWALRGSETGEQIDLGESQIEQRLAVRPTVGTARSTAEQQFYLASFGISLPSNSPFVFSLEGYFSHGQESFADAKPALEDLGLFFSGSYDFGFGSFSLTPELALGAGMSSLHLGIQQVTDVGLRERLALRLGYVLTGSTRVEASIFGMLSSVPRDSTIAPSLGQLLGTENGLLMFGLTLGLRYSP